MNQALILAGKLDELAQHARASTIYVGSESVCPLADKLETLAEEAWLISQQVCSHCDEPAAHHYCYGSSVMGDFRFTL